LNQVFGDKKAIAFFVLPAFILFVLIGFVPIVQSVIYSLQDWDGIHAPVFAALQSYIDMLTSDSFGVQFGNAVLNSLYLAALSVFVQLPVAFVLALVLANGVKGEKVYRTIFFIPVVISASAIGVMFLRILNADFGVLNGVLDAMGLSNLKHDWLSDPATALASIFIPALWQWIGYYMLLLYAAIKGIPDELYEAAKIDGASPLRTVFSIVIPLIRPVLRICVVFAVIGSLKFFDLTYVMTAGSASPATDVPSTVMYTTIFVRHLFGYGSAMAVFLVAECLVFYLVLQNSLKSEQEKGNS
jgi:raffinose/stachyose/melibiose transport system permease protein